MPGGKFAKWDSQGFQEALARVEREGIIEAPLAHISAEQLHALIEAAPRSSADHGRACLKRVEFVGATFPGYVDFAFATFTEGANFSGAIFPGLANFNSATFIGGADFSHATFNGKADFAYTTFTADIDWSDATYQESAEHLGVTVAEFLTELYGEDRPGDIHFTSATFTGEARFHSMVVDSNIHFRETRFARDGELGPMLVRDRCDLSRAVFERPVIIRLGASEVLLRRTTFERGADIFLRRASVSLDEADFAEPSLLTEITPEASSIISSERPPSGEDGWVCSSLGVVELPPPRVISLRHAKVAQLTISGLDLSPCRFAGAHGLDRLRVERARFAQPPGRRRWFSLRHWTRRQTIAEEHHLRSDPSEGVDGWYGDQVRSPSWLEDTQTPPDAGQIAAVYHALRKGLEDSRDEPGAGDFYYGEMEMRRAAARSAEGRELRATPLGERLVLWLYWLIAGYGLRTSRALAAFILTILVAAVPLAQWGIKPSPVYGRAVLFAAESSISLLRTPAATLSASGQAIEILLRVAGPLFFGLAIFSLRGRVKR